MIQVGVDLAKAQNQFNAQKSTNHVIQNNLPYTTALKQHE